MGERKKNALPDDRSEAERIGQSFRPPSRCRRATVESEGSGRSLASTRMQSFWQDLRRRIRIAGCL